MEILCWKNSADHALLMISLCKISGFIAISIDEIDNGVYKTE